METPKGSSAVFFKAMGSEGRFKECSSWSHYHFSAFSITFFSYALFHATRKTFSNSKTTMESEWTPFNTSFPEIYDYEGLFISGAIGDRFDLRKVLAIGMWLSAIMTFLFGTLSGWLTIYNYYWYVAFWLLGGLAQSSGWPCVLAIIGNWFGKSSRGLITGLWGASPSVGNIIGAYTVASVLHFGYEYAFLVPSFLMFACGIVVFFSVIPSPRDVGLPDVAEDEPLSGDREPLLRPDHPEFTESADSDEITLISRPDAISFCHALLIPGVIPYSLAYACLKLVNYSFFFWLPYYLQSEYGWIEAVADRLSVWYDVGGIIGGVLIGLASDKLGVRSPLMGIMLLLSPLSLFIYKASGSDLIMNGFLMGVTGFFIAGASNLVSTAISADLGRQKVLSGNKEALSTVTGIVDGTGSAGAAIGQLLVPLLHRDLGWNSVFYGFMIMTVLSLLCIIKIIVHDIQEVWKNGCFGKHRVLFYVSEDISSNNIQDPSYDS
ncbi:sugar phosphate exchanger 3-like isoform X2 [Tachypleus tridentatus]|uniref:sugar phosphate exchanger 3-like isoform X2 n=2 Tax=Tachypleus tridentatus TaxID=6853 RepID=UPI003FCF9C6D